MNSIQTIQPLYTKVNFKNNSNVQQAPKLQELENDSFGYQEEVQSALSKEDKQAIIAKTRKNALLSSAFFGPFSTAYFILRNNDKLAKSYNLDTKKDADFIKSIKNEQTILSLPGIIPGIGSTVSILGWLYCKGQNPENIDLEKREARLQAFF